MPEVDFGVYKVRMDTKGKAMNNFTCDYCSARSAKGKSILNINGENIEVVLEKLCPSCETGRIVKLGAMCSNCGGIILPNTQVGVMAVGCGEKLVCHTTYECSPAGGTFYGYWGEGKLLSSFESVEQC